MYGKFAARPVTADRALTSVVVCGMPEPLIDHSDRPCQLPIRVIEIARNMSGKQRVNQTYRSLGEALEGRLWRRGS